ncbi:MAG: peptidylprolyl isomerase [Candidatus Paceibacterota bacterium]|jgi:cyclophilin family peptidyl-prolyl cis-trans isomerase
MSKEITKILIIIAILIVVGWIVGSWMSKDLSPKTNTNMETKNLSWAEAPKIEIDKTKTYKALVKTTDGDLEIELYAKDNPITVNNFVFLAHQGFYENVKFHRIMKDFMIQTGDPTGTGSGGPGYQFADELPIAKKYTRGIVAMANAGPNTNGSQFFIMTKDYSLQPNYVIFGKIIEGLDTLDKIASTPVIDNGFGEKSKPTEDVLIKEITIEEK